MEYYSDVHITYSTMPYYYLILSSEEDSDETENYILFMRRTFF